MKRIRNMLKIIDKWMGKIIPSFRIEKTQDGEMARFSDTTRPAKLGLWVLTIGFGGFLLWAGLVPLDEGVPTEGMVVIAAKRTTVQHLTGGLVRQVLVREGQFVKKGDPLISLDDVAVRANFEEVRQRYLTLRAMESRLAAEQSDQAKIVFHPDLLRELSTPLVKQNITNQEHLFESRRKSLQAEMQASEEVIKGLEAAKRGAEGLSRSRATQLVAIEEELKGMRDLVSEGYAPRNKQLELERLSAEVSGAMSEAQSNIQRAFFQIAETRSRAIQRTQEYRKEVASILADVRREVQPDEQKFRAASNELSRMLIVAPVDGQVIGLLEQTAGGVISPGFKLMEIVPQNEQLVMETKVPQHSIDRIHNDQIVDVRFTSFARSPSLVVQGRVSSISSDVLTDARSGVSYYLGRVELTSEGIKQLGDHEMQPGMAAQVIFHTGERTLLTYLLHPFLLRLAASMKEK